ncbi:MAG: hypothetical protein V5786_02000 [Psychromonas sp.]
MMPKFNMVFITLLAISVLSNVALYKSMAHKSKLLIKSEQTEQLSLEKNSSLSAQIATMQANKMRSQQVTDTLQKELFESNKKSQKIRVIIKEVIKNAPCYNELIPYPADIGMHYD